MNKYFRNLVTWVQKYMYWILIGCIFLSLFLCILSFFFPDRTTYEKALVSDKKQVTEEIFDGKLIEHQFVVPENDFKGLSVLFHKTDDELSEGRAIFQLIEKSSGNQIMMVNKTIESLILFPQVVLEFPMQSDSKGKEYILNITTEGCNAEQAISFCLGKNTNKQITTFINNNPLNEMALTFSLTLEKNRYKFVWPLLLMATVFFTLLGTSPKLKKTKRL